MSPIPLNAMFDDPAMQWLVIGAGFFLIVYFVVRAMARRKKDPLDSIRSDHGGGSIAKQRGVDREMSNLLVELSEMARQVTDQLDARSTKLELLMKDADEKIETLRQMSAPTYAPPSPAPPSHAPFMRQTVAEREALLQPLVAPPSAPREPQTDARHAEIYAMADQGRTPIDIASRLGRPSGEIELILALRQ